VLVLDSASRRLIDNVIEEDAILNENVTSMLAPKQIGFLSGQSATA
jgi:hypothetical protein